MNMQNITINSCGDAIHAVEHLEKTGNWFLCNLYELTREFPRVSLVTDPEDILVGTQFNILSVAIQKNYKNTENVEYTLVYHLDCTSWCTLVKSLMSLREDSPREDLKDYYGECSVFVKTEPIEESGYVKCSFDFNGCEFICLMSKEKATRWGFISEEYQQISIEEAQDVRG